jgi:hypothetical protein
MQAMKMFGGNSSGKSGQNQLVGMAMGEAAKLFGMFWTSRQSLRDVSYT